MIITVDRDVCFGSGECVLAAPSVFELDDQGLARLRGDADLVVVGAATAERIAAECPSGAIRVTHEAIASATPEERD